MSVEPSVPCESKVIWFYHHTRVQSPRLILGGLAAAFPGMARQLGASRVVGTVRASKLPAAAKSRLPYDQIIDSADFDDALGGERFDIVIDAVGGAVRSSSFALMKPGSRLIVAGNASLFDIYGT